MASLGKKERINARIRNAIFFSIALLAIATPPLTAEWLREDAPVCTDPAQQTYPRVSPDGLGGAIVTWSDARDASDWGDNLYAQRLDASGNPLWISNGIKVDQTEFAIGYHRSVPDGTGGALIAFESVHSPCAMCEWVARIYLARVAADGNRLWQKLARTVNEPSWYGVVNERNMILMPDGTGGAVMVWQSAHGFECDPLCMDPPCCMGWEDYDVYAQRIDAQGNLLWDSLGVQLCPDASPQMGPQAVMIDSSIVIAWYDYRNGSGNSDVYAQKIDLDGNILWDPLGIPVCLSPGNQFSPRISTDGLGGAFISWMSGSSSNAHVYAQRLDPSGNAIWNPNGIPVCTVNGQKDESAIIPGIPGRSIVFWTNVLNGIPALHAQRLDLDGNLLWNADGKQLSDAANMCTNVRAVPDGAGGAVFAWESAPDSRSPTILQGVWGSSSSDIFAVGDRAVVLRFNGRYWYSMERAATQALNDVWGSSGADVFAVGDGGTIIHYDGTSWSQMTSGVTANLSGVWGSSATDVFAVGTNCTILHYDGSSWTRMSYTGGGNLTAVHGSSGTNVFAVGYMRLDGMILSYNGTGWSRMDTYAAMLGGVWVSPDNQVFVSGTETNLSYFGGILLQNDGTGWRKTRTNFPSKYSGSEGRGIWGTYSNNVYAIFSDGCLMHYDGAAWAKTIVGTSATYDVWGTFGSDIWVVGSPFLIRHFEEPNWITQNQFNSDLFMQRVDASGDVLWRSVGAPATVSLDQQSKPSLAYDPAGYALLVWQDNRRGNWDIFSRRVSISRGPIVATELAASSAEISGPGIRVDWRLSRCDGEVEHSVSRAEEDGDRAWTTIDPSIERSGLSFGFTDAGVEPSKSYRYQVIVSDAAGSRVLFETEAIAMPPLPLTLYQNYPNPFNPSTTIRYYLPERCHVRLNVYDAAGRLVARLVDRDEASGSHSIEWKGTDSLGKRAASGIYFYRLTAGKETISRKMVLLR